MSSFERNTDTVWAYLTFVYDHIVHLRLLFKNYAVIYLSIVINIYDADTGIKKA